MPENLTVFGRRRVWGAFAICSLMMLLLLAAGCTAPAAAPNAPAAQAVATTSTSTSTSTPAIVLPAITASVSAPVTSTTTVEATATTVPEETATPTVTGTPPTSTPRPTPANPPPANPVDRLNVFDVITSGNMVIKRDLLPLDRTQTDNVLVTSTGARLGATNPLTQEITSALAVMTYDPVYYEWNLSWQSDPISGTARPLPAANQFGGTNGADLLRDGSAVLQLRTTTLDGVAHLQLFRYDRATHTATLLKMVPELGKAEQDAIFTADLDVNMADLDDDGVYEVIADNVTGVLTWRWDGSKYVPRVRR